MPKPIAFNDYSPDSRGLLQVQIGDTWYRVPKVRNVGFTATTPTDTTTEYVDQPTETRSGSSGPGSVTYDLSRAPTKLAYRRIYDAFKTGESLTFRDFGGDPTKFDNASTSGRSIAIAAPSPVTRSTNPTATATLTGLSAGTPDSPTNMFRPGKMFVIDSVAYTIEEVLTDTTLTISRYGATSAITGVTLQTLEDTIDWADVPAEVDFQIYEPSTMREFNGRVTEMGAYSRAASNEPQTDRMVVNVLAFPNDRIILEV